MQQEPSTSEMLPLFLLTVASIPDRSARTSCSTVKDYTTIISIIGLLLDVILCGSLEHTRVVPVMCRRDLATRAAIQLYHNECVVFFSSANSCMLVIFSKCDFHQTSCQVHSSKLGSRSSSSRSLIAAVEGEKSKMAITSSRSKALRAATACERVSSVPNNHTLAVPPGSSSLSMPRLL